MEQVEFRQKIIEEMKQIFASDCLVRPENPFSIDNPDALVRKGTTLYAIFVPMYHERINFDHLLRRLFSSELAYGSKLHTVLILKEDDKLSEYGESVLNAAFCHISRGKIDAISYLSSRVNIGRNWSRIGDIKQWMFQQYDVNNLTIDFADKTFVKNNRVDNYQLDLGNVSSPSWFINNKRRIIKNVARCGNTDMCIKRKGKRQTFRDGFENIMTQSFLKSFRLTDGYLEPYSMVVDNIFGIATDWCMFTDEGYHNMYHRTLSFAGILPLNIVDEEQLNCIHNYYMDIQNRIRHDHR